MTADRLALEAALAQSDQAHREHEPQLGAPAAEKAMALARALADAPSAARAACQWAMHLARLGHLEAAITLAQTEMAAIDQHGTPVDTIEVRLALCYALCTAARSVMALPHAVQALASARALALPGLTSRCLNMLSLVYDGCGDRDRAMTLLRDAAHVAEEDGAEMMRFAAQVNLASRCAEDAQEHARLGRDEAARTSALEGLHFVAQAHALAHGQRRQTMYCLAAEAELLDALADTAAMGTAVAKLRALAPGEGTPYFVFTGDVLHANWLTRSGRALEACRWLELHFDLAQLDINKQETRALHEARCRAYAAADLPAQALAATQDLLRAERSWSTSRIQAQNKALLQEAEVRLAQQESALLREQALALNERANQASHDAHEDVLTGLPNRRALDAHVNAALSDVAAPRAPTQRKLYCAMIDIDHFKRVNDTLGHDVGDQVLRQIAQLLNQDLAAQDFVARNGGEEFVLLLTRPTQADAWMACEQLRARVAAHPWATVSGLWPITISLGLTAAVANDDPPSLMRRADAAMYRAKHAGRNQVVTG